MKNPETTFALRRITPPASLPVTLEEAKAELRVEHPADDATIARMVASAVALLDGRDGFLGRCLKRSRRPSPSFPTTGLGNYCTFFVASRRGR